MSVWVEFLDDRASWLEARKDRIGGSEAAAIVGASPYSNNVDLWELKTGRREAEDIGDNPYVKYGSEAEEYLRRLFELDFPNYTVMYAPDNMWLNDKIPFAHASLDGWLIEKDTGRKGVLEIKTATLSTAVQKQKWSGQIPQHYFVQVLHYLMVTEFDFAVLKAQLKYEREGGDVLLVTKHYKIEREDYLRDIDYLEAQERIFREYWKNGERPPLVLPSI